MKILLIEDDLRIIEFLLRGLAQEGYEVSLARDGLSGLARAQADSWDLILLDLMLPLMDGRELCQILRTTGDVTPILMLTALETTDDIVRGLNMGAEDYLTKPFAFEELVARIEILRRRPKETNCVKNGVLAIGDITFDQAALQVQVRGQTVTLTSLEYALLEFLMVEAGSVVSREHILQNVWGTREDPLTNVVDVYIRKLRKAIEACGVAHPITTIRGRGYRFEN